MPQLTPGDTAPDFTLQDQDGNALSLKDLRGGKVLIYFYPKADTPGCTTQSCAIRDAADPLGAANVRGIGISRDAPDALKAFDDKYSLGFTLLSDPEHSVAEAYGAWGERSMYGKTYMGIVRSSFLVDEQGIVQQAWYKVSPKETVPKALAAL